MADAQTILVIFLSTALAIFIVLGIILLVFLIDIIQRVKRITEKAEHAVEKAEAAAEFAKKVTMPASFTKLATALISYLTKKSK